MEKRLGRRERRKALIYCSSSLEKNSLTERLTERLTARLQERIETQFEGQTNRDKD